MDITEEHLGSAAAYPLRDLDTAPEDVRPALTALLNVFGLIPNAAGVMANSPTLLNTFFAAFGSFRSGTFTPAERQALLLTNAVVNSCPWSVAFHSHTAEEDGVSRADIDAVRRGDLPGDPRQAALSTVTRALIERRGQLADADVKSFVEAGFDLAQLLEVITGVAISAMTNYAANVADPPLEEALRPWSWTAGD